jgi:membrane protein YdbS with pleckstrin-like domain
MSTGSPDEYVGEVEGGSLAPASPAELQNNLGLRLHEGERIVADVQPSKWWTLGRYIITLGLWAIWRGRNHYVLTNERIIHIKGIISKTERSAPLSRIQDAELNRSPLTGGKVVLSTAGGSLGFNTIAPLTRADALALHDALMPLIRHTRSGV